MVNRKFSPEDYGRKAVEFPEQGGINFIRKDQWLPSSRDAAPCDYFLWGYLKSRLNKRKLKTLAGLKKFLKEEFDAIPSEMIDRALKSWPKRMRQIYYAKGGHIQK